MQYQPKTKPIRLAILASHFIQYNTPIFRALAQREDIEITVYYLSEHGRKNSFDAGFGTNFKWDLDLDTGYDWQMIVGGDLNNPYKRSLQGYMELISLPFKLDADVVLYYISYDHWASLLTLYGFFLKRLPILYRGDTNLLTERVRYRMLKRILLSPVFKNDVWGCYVGKLARDYILSLGTPVGRLIFTPHCVDDAHWVMQAETYVNRRNELMKAFDLPIDRPVVLFAGKLVENKKVFDLLAALSVLTEKRKVSLLIAGSGDQEMRLRSMADGIKNLTSRFLGFVNQSELPQVYAVADIICLPSASETWGLVVNEAMYFGCVPVVSDRVGCVPDLVDGIGEAFPVGNVSAFSHALSHVLDELPARRKLIPDRLRQYSIASCVDGISRGCRLAVAR